jgi:hypothetical protein
MKKSALYLYAARAMWILPIVFLILCFWTGMIFCGPGASNGCRLPFFYALFFRVLPVTVGVVAALGVIILYGRAVAELYDKHRIAEFRERQVVVTIRNREVDEFQRQGEQEIERMRLDG